MEFMWEPRKRTMETVLKGEWGIEPEMTEFESAFVCGLIKENRPKKILEIGVAGGGTTAIVMQCLNELNLKDTEFISVDLNERLYNAPDKETGYIAKEAKKIYDTKHRFVFGHVIAEVIEEIGEEIDFVILDTVHFLPGEVLDFPVILPFMSKNAIVVLHDVAFHQYYNKDGIACQTLFDAATGIKILPMGSDDTRTTKMPNIGAIKINEDTRKYIDAVFHAMTLPWNYMPEKNVINAYRRIYDKYYGEDMADFFDTAVAFNRNLLNKSNKPVKKYKFKIRIIYAARIILKGY